MQEFLLDPPFTVLPSHRFVADWTRVAVVKAKKIFGKLTERERVKLGIEPIDGDSKPQWMKDVEHKIVVVKSDRIFERPFGTCHSVANDKIAADLAQYLKLPIPRVVIWERIYSRGRREWLTVTPRVFANSRRGPPIELLLRDKALPAMAVLDGYAKDGDGCGLLNMVYQTTAPPEKPVIAHLDKSLADFEELIDYRGVDPVRYAIDYWGLWSPTIRNHVRDQIAHSPEVNWVITRIEKMPDHVIKDIVHEIPDALFHSAHSKRKIVDNMRRGQENLRRHVYESFGLA